MTLKQIKTIATVTVITISWGFAGLSGHVCGQEPLDPIAPPLLTTETGDVEAHALPTLGAPPVVDHSGAVRRQKAKQIAAALDQVLLLEFSDAPLTEVVDYLKIACQVSIVIDRRALQDIGLETSAPITCSFSEITLRSSLSLLLTSLDLDYVIRNEVLMITTMEVASTQLDPRIYSVDGLHIESEKLIQLITHMVAPESWEELGGAGRIDSLDGARPGLVIAQTDQIHDRVADFLEKLRHATSD